ncbi:MAG: DUF3592 domain-containing protein [Anaerolineales bacterium]|nr:DUF3592 domain-containing protein [Anaerolineales bacterium]
MDFGLILAYGAFAIFGLAGVLLIVQGISRLRLAARTRAWASTLGMVVESRVKQDFIGDAINYQPLVRYTFSYRGQEFESDQIFIGSKFFTTPSKALPYVHRYPEGRSVRVYYDPQDPSQSFLETGRSSRIYIDFVIGLGLIGVALVILMVLNA